MNETALRRATLPNGMNVAYQSKAELNQFYDDIFLKHVYSKNGIALEPGSTIFDVGANVGMFTIFISYSFPGSRIFSFEPAPPLFEILSANATWCEGEVVLFNCGLSSQAGSAHLTFYPQSSGMSSFYPAAEEEKAALKTLFHNELTRGDKPGADQLLRYEDELVEQRFKSESWTCPLRTLSEVMAEYGIDGIDLLKIDVEKSELDVLAGLAEPDWRKVRQVVIEVHDLPGRIAQVTELFSAHGFKVQVEQDDLYQGSDRFNLYALRR